MSQEIKKDTEKKASSSHNDKNEQKAQEVKKAKIESSGSETQTTKKSSEKVVNKKFEKLIHEIEKMTIKELNEFVQTVQNYFDIKPLVSSVASTNGESKALDKASVILTEIGQSKISVIKVLASISGKGLIEAKQILEKLPATIAADKPMSEAENIKSQLESAGAVIELK